ncbi:MAG: hypothetical protein U9Q75_08570 [Pseudomonadota bacterium]|nr:hypothetical protein [Pseudomonadota bacterium]
MIRIAIIFIIGIALALYAIYDWRVALRITIPITLIIASLIGLDIYQTNQENKQRETQRVTQERNNAIDKSTTHTAPAEAPQRLDAAAIELQRIQQAENRRKLAEENKSTIKAFFSDNQALIEVYFNAASRCNSDLTFAGRMNENRDCLAAIEAKQNLQEITERTLTGISNEALKKEDSTTMWRIEYADHQMDSAYQRSKRR